MNKMASTVDGLLNEAARATAASQWTLAEQQLQRAHALAPQDPRPLAALGQLCLETGQPAEAARWFGAAHALAPDNAQHGLDHAYALLSQERLAEAQDVLERTLVTSPQSAPAWLMLGQIREAREDAQGALRAFHQAVSRAQALGQWRDTESTPPAMLDAVLHAVQVLRRDRRALLLDSYDEIRRRIGASALRRVDRAVDAYLKLLAAPPPSEHQKPRFFYFPDLPPGPYHDPFLHPWAPQLRDAFPSIRDEALRTLSEDSHFESFIRYRDTVRIEDYLRGQRGKPAWEAFFFYRHGQRYDAHHARCPETSRALESIPLCRIAGEAPEICYSVLTPGTEILPHYGVTNVRLVMHLPLLVPPDCALNVRGGGEHHWREGELMLFDDTYLHEAWNRSDGTRVILLMDCWNPHLDPAEREATRLLIETISGLGRAGVQRDH